MEIDSVSAAYNKKAQDLLRKNGSYSKTTLDSTDFLKLIAAQLQNQDMTNPMSNSEMMQQLSQMSSIQTMTELQTAITNMNDIAVTNYSASLVGKEVTVAAEDSKGNLKTIEGLVTGTGLYGGETVVFVDGKAYSLSQIMAVGKIPEEILEGEETDKVEDDKTEGTEEVKPDDDKTEGTEEVKPDDDKTEGTEEVKPEA